MKKLCKDIKLRMCDNIAGKEANANYLHRDIKIDTKMLYLQAIEEFDTGIDCQEARDYDE